MKKNRANTDAAAAMEADNEDEQGIADISLSENSDLCDKLMERYGKSSAPQHRHLCASAAAMKTILQEERLPLTPPAYFAATISAIDDQSESLDSPFTASLISFLSILLPLLPSQSLPPSKAMDAVNILVRLLRNSPEGVATSAVRSVVKSLGVLMVLCDLEDWKVVQEPFETIVALAIDKRPKVRRCAQMCVEKAFRSFQCSSVIKEASKAVLSLFKSYMPLAIELSAERAIDPSKCDVHFKNEHFKVLHALNLLKLTVPYLSKKVSSEVLSSTQKLLTCNFTQLTRHIFGIIKAYFESSRAEAVIPEAEKLIVSLASFINFPEKNPMDAVMSASVLLKLILGELHHSDINAWIGNLPLVFGSILGLLVSHADTSSQAAGILKDLINNQVDNGKFMRTAESRAIESICVELENALSNNEGVPNEHMLAVISDLFFKLGEISYTHMKGILLKLADFMLAIGDVAKINHLHDCIGSAVVAMGPEKILTVIPISFQAENVTCSNMWLVPILKRYVIGASLDYFLENIVPLVESLQRACHKVKKAPLQNKLRSYICDLWDLLPAFCRYPTDTQKSFEPLAKLCTDFLKKESFMHENIALALRELVNQNRAIVKSSCGASESGTHLGSELKSVPDHYSRKVANRNIKVLRSFSVDLLQALTDVFFESPPEKRIVLKEAIGCLASITETSIVKRIFTSSLERFKLSYGVDTSEKLESGSFKSVHDKLGGNFKEEERGDAQRSIMMEFASSIVEGANEDFINLIFDYIRPALQDTVGFCQSEAYCTLSRIFKEHTWFISSRFEEMMNLLVGVKLPVDTVSLRSHFACLHDLFVYTMQVHLEKKNAKAFLILNEIILALKSSNEEARKAAYDVLLRISYSLKSHSCVESDSPHQQLFNMIMGYLSGAPPQIMSGAVSALSLLIYKDNDVCFSIPEMVPSVLVLLQSKAKEVIKVVLGFVKVLVSSLQASDLKKFLPDILNGILPWSSVSRNHFRSKVTVILEIIIRKCSASSVESLASEKYKGFIKSVLEQRHGRTNSKEAETPEMALQSTSAYIQSGHKRTRGELNLSVEGTGSVASGASPNKKRDKKHKLNPTRTSKVHKSTGFGTASRRERRSMRPQAKTMMAKSSERRKQNGNDFNKRSRAGRTEKMGVRGGKKTGKPRVHKPASTSKPHKHGKVAEKPERTKA